MNTRFFLLSVLLATSAPARTLVETGAATEWKYIDTGSAPASGWSDAAFDDSQWPSGKAPLGYGEKGLGTELHFGTDKKHKPLTQWFRRSFEAPTLQPGEKLVVVLCVDDGAALYLNGREIARTNLPAGPLVATIPASRTLGDPDEGLYQRFPVPVDALHPGRNVLAVEVHQATPTSSDCFFDLALKTVPADIPPPAVQPAAENVVTTYLKQHYLGPDLQIPDGYIDGGRGMKFDADSHAKSGREILLVDRTKDTALALDLAFARSPELQALPPLERAQRLAARIDAETTPPGGIRWVGKTTEDFETEFKNKPLYIGEWVDQCHSGVCRHRSLLFKILADEAGLKSALVRGNYAGSSGARGAHAWNELYLEDGRRVLVDVMHKRDAQKFPEVTSPDVISHYLRVDNTPWYHAKGE